MNILVLNGSPKGANSITLQTLLYLEKLHPEHHFSILHAAAKIHKYEQDFAEVRAAIEDADILIFSYPVYTFIAPAQLHRFIELMQQNHVDLRGKAATQFTTSKHFYDVTAHEFIRLNLQDLGASFVKGLSADMEDLLQAEGQKQARDFFDYLLYCIREKLFEPMPESLPERQGEPVEPGKAQGNGNKPGNVVLLTDAPEGDARLCAMIERFIHQLPRKVEIIDIGKIGLKGGCISCFHCAAEGKCIYLDGFDRFLRERVQSAEALVTAFTIRNHSMGALFKMYDDRQFCNGHRTVTMGMPMGYLVNGALEHEPNLRMILQARAEVGGNFLAGIATNTDGIDALTRRLNYAIEHRYTQPRNFYGVGGMKIFRDLIWQMQGLMRADHRFFKAHGQYDFPQKRRMDMWKMYAVGLLFRNQKLQKKLGGKISEGMLAPYKKIIESSIKT